jgi:DUF4097 and DUF4098 domain-containing protein YvlB
MTTISTLMTGWLIGAAATAAAPLPSYDVLGDRVATERDSTARTSSAQETEKERERERQRQQEERERQQRERERQQEERQRQQERAQQEREEQREAARQQRDAQREQWRVHVREQQKRVSDQRERQNREWVEVEGDRIVKSFSVGKTGSLLLHNISGDVVVTSGGGSEIRVEAIKKAKGRSQGEARQQLDNVVLTMQEAGGRVDIRVEPRGRESRAWIDFNVIVPYGASAEIHSVSGDISLTGVKGEVRAETVSGDVKGTGLTQLAAAKSVSGDVVLNNVESDGTLVLSAVSGDVTATGLKARAIEVSAVSGDTVLNQCVAERAQVSTVNGDISYNGKLSKSGRYELKTHSGDIVVNHQGSAFEVEASTFNGDIKFDQPLPGTAKANTNRYGPGRSVRGAMGGGGAYLELTTFSGDITVSK